MLRDNSARIKFNRVGLRDRIYACWLGKNIGGTMGCPIEGKRSICDVQGFTSEGVLTNDDLDLQLVWLRAVDELGPDNINARNLGEYWLSYVAPWWNEYGVCKRNMQEGLLPPLSGSALNDEWKRSNGAWIRTEVWACLSPGCPEQAARFAFEDASVDHGLNEGTYAAVFVAAMEAAAFVVKDMRTLLEIGLSKIPGDCRIARSVKIVINSYEEGVDWKETRQRVVEDSSDLGWMQAPANVAFTVIGLLYGEGDFKQTLITAINCGDDTDCTGATAGSVMGILYGTSGIPEDWCAFLGDDLKVTCIVQGQGEWPETCNEVTDSVMALLPSTIRPKITRMILGLLPIADSKSDMPVEIWDGEDDFSVLDIERYYGSYFFEKMAGIAARTPYVIKQDNVYADLWVELDREPVIAPGGELTGRVSISLKHMPEQKCFRLRWICPEGWQVNGVKNIRTDVKDLIGWDDDSHGKLTGEELFDGILANGEFVIKAGENVEAVNRIVLEASCVGRPMPLYVPISILG